MQLTDLGIAFGLGLLWQAQVWLLNRRQVAISFASIRTWVLFLLSGLAVYWLQPAMPIRSLDFWLPTATLGLAALGWALTAAPEQRRLRQVLPGGLALLGLILLVGLTRYLGLTGLITATRPPQAPFIVLALLVVAILFVLLIRWPRKALLGVGIVLLIGLLVALKLPALTALVATGLRSLAGQSVSSAAATDLRWLGFSYIAFRLIHTLRDRQTGRAPAASLPEYMAYVVFFPALTAGPIDRLERFLKDLRAAPASPVADLQAALPRLALGLLKKFVLADLLALIALSPANAAQIRTAGWLWLTLVAYSLQIFLDFSGYTDLAIGLGRLFGIRLPENFNNPYLRPNLAQFWNNWHMTLTQWFRGYFFNPFTRALRQSKRPLPIWAVILLTQLATMILIGLWHGITWNFVAWGAWHGLGLFINNRWTEWVRPRLARVNERPAASKALMVLSTLFTFVFVTLGWVWFALPLDQAILVFGRLF